MGQESAAPDARRNMLVAWLASIGGALGLRAETLRPASSDASFRRYFRTFAGGRSYVLIDAPPPLEDAAPSPGDTTAQEP